MSMQIPRLHKRLTLVIGCCLVLVGLSGLGDNTYQAEQDIEQILAELPSPQTLPETDITTATSDPTVELFDEVKQGDNLASIFQRNGFGARDVHAITSTDYGKQLKEIFPGHRLSFTKLGDTLQTLTYSTDRLTSYTFRRNGDGFIAQKDVFQPERVTTYKHSSIDSSLFVASQRAGLPDNLTMRLAQIFQWDIDFVFDIRPGDEFFVLFEEL